MNVTVVPMDGERLLEGRTVLVRDGRIVAIAAAAGAQAPDGATVVDARGKYLMPGLAEMHAHVPGEQDPALAHTMALYVLAGATTVRAMLGTPFQLELRRRLERGELFGPTLFAVAPPFNPESLAGPDDARARVRAYHAAGYDQLKIFGVDSQATYDAIAETAREVGIRFAGHVPPNIGIRHAIAMGQSVEHLDGYLQASDGDPARMDGLARAAAKARVWNTPTMDVMKTLLGVRSPEELDARAELAYVRRSTLATWHERTAALSRGSYLRRALVGVGLRRSPADLAVLRDRMLLALHRAGAPLLLGADSPQLYSVPGFSLAHEMRAMVEAGLPVYAVLEAATRNPAAYFGRSGEFGQVAPGMRADLLLLEANPLEDVANVRRQAGVMVRGCWLSREEIQSRLAQIAEAVRAQAEEDALAPPG